MGHEIYKEKFFVRDVKPAWHRIGVNDENLVMGAVEAQKRFAPAEYDIVPLVYQWGNEQRYVPQKAIIMRPIDNGEHVHVATVSDQYHIVQPSRIAEIIDEEIGLPVETVGILQKGKRVFFSFKTESYDVGGDQIDPYTVIDCPVDGLNAYSVCLTQWRPVCKNTLMAALENAQQILPINHTQHIEADFRESLQVAMTIAGRTNLEIKDIFEMFAATPAGEEQVREISHDLFELPAKPEKSHLTRINEQREELFEKQTAKAWAKRHAMLDCWNGKNYEQRNGYYAESWNSAWGAYNAATEVIQYGGSNVKNKADRPMFNKTVRSEMQKAFAVVQQFTS